MRCYYGVRNQANNEEEVHQKYCEATTLNEEMLSLAFRGTRWPSSGPSRFRFLVTETNIIAGVNQFKIDRNTYTLTVVERN
jgi:hypothetical protein